MQPELLEMAGTVLLIAIGMIVFGEGLIARVGAYIVAFFACCLGVVFVGLVFTGWPATG